MPRKSSLDIVTEPLLFTALFFFSQNPYVDLRQKKCQEKKYGKKKIIK